jgi:hypothetical protein
MQLCPIELRTRYRQGRLIPFIGAGVSASVQWEEGGKMRRGPTWSELVDQAARKLGFADPELLAVRGTNLQILEYFGIKRHQEFAGLTNWLAKELNASDEALLGSPIHKELSKLDNCKLFYTTNYDDLLERGLRLNGRSCRRVVVESDMSSLDNSGTSTEVVKFHGDLEFPNHMVLSESHYERRLRLDTPMDYKFQADLLGRVVLFIGYSFRDWNVSYLFRLINEKFNQLPGSLAGKRAYITVPDPSDFEDELFRARNIQVIPISERKQVQEIAKLLEEIGQ